MAPQHYPRISHPTPLPSTISQNFASNGPLAIRQLACDTDSYIDTATTETIFTDTITTQVTNTRELTQLQKSDANNPARTATWTQEFVSLVTITTTGKAPTTTTRCLPLYDKPTKTSTSQLTSSSSTSTASSTSSPLQTSVPASDPISSSTTEMATSRSGVIVGSSIAGVVLLIILGLAFSCILYRRRARRVRRAAAQSTPGGISNPRPASVKLPKTSYYNSLARGAPDLRIGQDYVGDMESVSVRASVNAQNTALIGEAVSLRSWRSFATALQATFQLQPIVHPDDAYGELTVGHMRSQMRPTLPVLPVPEQPFGFSSDHTSANTNTPLIPATKEKGMMTKIVNIDRKKKEVPLSVADADRTEISKKLPPLTGALARMSTRFFLLPRSLGRQATMAQQPDIYPDAPLSSSYLPSDHEYEAVIPEPANSLVTTSSGESVIRPPDILPLSERHRDSGNSNNQNHGYQTHGYDTASNVNRPYLAGNSPQQTSRAQLDYQSDVSAESNPHNWSSSPLRPPVFAHLGTSTRHQRHFEDTVSREKGGTRGDNPYFWAAGPQVNAHSPVPERSRTAPGNRSIKEKVYQYRPTSTRDLSNINSNSYGLDDLAETVYNPSMHPTPHLKVRPPRISSVDAPTTAILPLISPPQIGSTVSLSIYSQNSRTTSVEELSGIQENMPDPDTKEIDDAIAATAFWEIRHRREALERLEDIRGQDTRPNYQITNTERSTIPIEPPPAPGELSDPFQSTNRLLEEQIQKPRGDILSRQEWRKRFGIERAMRREAPGEIMRNRREAYAKLCGKHPGWVDPKAKGFRIDYSKLEPDALEPEEYGTVRGETQKKGASTTPPALPPKGRGCDELGDSTRREANRRHRDEALRRRSPDKRSSMGQSGTNSSRNQEEWGDVVEDERVLAAREAMRIRGEGVSDTNMTDFDMDAFLEKERLKPPRMRTPSRPEVPAPASAPVTKDNMGEV